jgi:hypothetical protein
MTAINVFSRRVNKDRARFHITKDIRGSGRVRAKALTRSFSSFVEVCSEVNHHVIIRYSLDCLFVANVETRTAGKVLGSKEILYKRP